MPRFCLPPRHQLFATPDNVLHLANQRLSLNGVGTEKAGPIRSAKIRMRSGSAQGATSSSLTARMRAA
eukprot:6196286-Pleurochrysis_carterae.AAC.1